MSKPHYYKSSQKSSTPSFLYFGLLCLTVFPLLGYIYALAIIHIPFIYIRFLFTAGLVYAITYLIDNVVIDKGKVRNSTHALGFKFLGAFWTFYFHWAAWEMMVAGSNDLSSILNMVISPLAVIQTAQLFNIVGVWGFEDSPVNGTFLWVIWAIEAAIILLGIFFLSSNQEKEPFCEENGDWFKKKVYGPLGYVRDPKDLKSKLENGDESVLLPLLLTGRDAQHNFSVATIYWNETDENYLTITNMEAYTEKDEIKHNEKHVIKRISVSEELSNTLSGKKKPEATATPAIEDSESEE